MTNEQTARALRLLRQRGDPSLTAFFLDPGDPAFRLPPVPASVLVRKAVRPKDLPGAVRIPADAAVYYGVPVPGPAYEKNAAGWAAVSPPVSGFRTITAETLPAFRRQGVASACLLSLLSREEGPFLYLVRRQNLASVRLALHCGFRPVPGA